MTDVFIPHGYASKTFWPVKNDKTKDLESENDLIEIQPFSVYQLDHPHVIRKRPGHYGASPRCRGSASESIDLVRKVLQPAINYEIVEVFKNYISVFRDAAENISSNMTIEPFTTCSTPEELDVDSMVYRACSDALEHCKTLFDGRKGAASQKSKNGHILDVAGKQNLTSQPMGKVASSLPNRMAMKRVPSPDFPWSKRLTKGSPRRSLSPTPRPPKRSRATFKGYGSPHSRREPLNRDNWDPEKLTIETKFVMGTRANKALGLGATRGRIYMKHPDLFKYSSDPEDKKWMVKNNCMAATGGKNTFIMMADVIYDLLENEYKDSPHLQPEEMQVFNLPEFILHKMRQLMIKEKKLYQKLTRKTASPVSPYLENKKSEYSNKSVATLSPQQVRGTYSPHHSKRSAAAAAAAAITASSEEIDDLNNDKTLFVSSQSDIENLSAEDRSESGWSGRSLARVT